MARHRQRHISGWPAYLLAPALIVVVILAKTNGWVFGLKRTEDLTAEDVVGYLENFLKGAEESGIWDDFCCIPITDPTLEAIRQQAALVQCPLDEAGEAELRTLLARARSLAKA